MQFEDPSVTCHCWSLHGQSRAALGTLFQISLPIFCLFLLHMLWFLSFLVSFFMPHTYVFFLWTPSRIQHHPVQRALSPSAGSRPPLCVLIPNTSPVPALQDTRRLQAYEPLPSPLSDAAGEKGNLTPDVRESKRTLQSAKRSETAHGLSNRCINPTEHVLL